MSNIPTTLALTQIMRQTNETKDILPTSCFRMGLLSMQETLKVQMQDLKMIENCLNFLERDKQTRPIYEEMNFMIEMAPSDFPRKLGSELFDKFIVRHHENKTEPCWMYPLNVWFCNLVMSLSKDNIRELMGDNFSVRSLNETKPEEITEQWFIYATLRIFTFLSHEGLFMRILSVIVQANSMDLEESQTMENIMKFNHLYSKLIVFFLGKRAITLWKCVYPTVENDVEIMKMPEVKTLEILKIADHYSKTDLIFQMMKTAMTVCPNQCESIKSVRSARMTTKNERKHADPYYAMKMAGPYSCEPGMRVVSILDHEQQLSIRDLEPSKSSAVSFSNREVVLSDYNLTDDDKDEDVLKHGETIGVARMRLIFGLPNPHKEMFLKSSVSYENMKIVNFPVKNDISVSKLLMDMLDQNPSVSCMSDSVEAKRQILIEDFRQVRIKKVYVRLSSLCPLQEMTSQFHGEIFKGNEFSDIVLTKEEKDSLSKGMINGVILRYLRRFKINDFNFILLKAMSSDEPMKFKDEVFLYQLSDDVIMLDDMNSDDEIDVMQNEWETVD